MLDNGIQDIMFKTWMLGIALIVVGMLIIIAGTLYAMSTAHREFGRVEGGVVILIGPIPIVVGTAKTIHWLILLAIILTVLAIVLYIVLAKFTPIPSMSAT